MIAEIRDYFRGVITTIDSDLKEHDQPLISDNIADTIIQDSYFVLIGDMSSERIDSTIDSNISVTVELYKNGYNDSIDNYDKGYCKAIDVQSLAMKQDRISQLTSLKSVVSNGISTETINTNDNLFKYSIQFTVTVSYFYE